MDKITIAFVKNTGRIVAIHAGELEDLLQNLSNNKHFLDTNKLENVNNIDSMIAEADLKTFNPSDYFIENRKLKRLKKIELSTDALDVDNPNGIPEIKGDGKSHCVLTATVQKPDGSIDKKFTKPIKFNTSRGKLSARNGIVKAKEGVARIILTSVPETVPPFKICANADGCIQGTIMLEFY